MNALNSIILEGNVVRDPLVRETPRGTQICCFSLASNRFFKTSEGFDSEVSYFDIEAWGKLATICTQNCPKGRGVRVVGRLKQNRWKGTDGKNYSRISIVAEHVEFKPVFNKPQQENASEDSDTAADDSAAEILAAACLADNMLNKETSTVF